MSDKKVIAGCPEMIRKHNNMIATNMLRYSRKLTLQISICILCLFCYRKSANILNIHKNLKAPTAFCWQLWTLLVRRFSHVQKPCRCAFRKDFHKTCFTCLTITMLPENTCTNYKTVTKCNTLAWWVKNALCTIFGQPTDMKSQLMANAWPSHSSPYKLCHD